MTPAQSNILFGVSAEGLWGLGMGFILPQVILPLALVDLGQSASIAGLIGSIFSLGILLPQAFSALALPPRFTDPKPLALLHSPALLGVLGTGLGFYLLPLDDRMGRLIVLLAGFTFFSFSIGLVSPHWIAATGRCIPEKMRGRYFGACFFSAGLGGTGTGWLASRWAAEGGLAWGYALCFMVAAVPIIASMYCLTRLRPLKPRPHSPPPKALRGSFKLILGKIKEKGSFRTGMILTTLMSLVATPGNLFTVYLREQAKIGVSRFEIFTPAVTLGAMAGAYFLGWLVDHKGLRTAFGAAFTAGLASILLVVLWGHPSLPVLAFFLSGVIGSAFPVITLVMILKMASHKESTVQAGLFNTLWSPLSLAPLLAGWIADRAGYSWIFGVSAACAVIAFWILMGSHDLDGKPGTMKVKNKPNLKN